MRFVVFWESTGISQKASLCTRKDVRQHFCYIEAPLRHETSYHLIDCAIFRAQFDRNDLHRGKKWSQKGTERNITSWGLSPEKAEVLRASRDNSSRYWQMSVSPSQQKPREHRTMRSTEFTPTCSYDVSSGARGWLRKKREESDTGHPSISKGSYLNFIFIFRDFSLIFADSAMGYPNINDSIGTLWLYY